LQKGDQDGAIELYKKAITAAPGRLRGTCASDRLTASKDAEACTARIGLAFPDGAHFLNTVYYQQLQADTFFERGLVYQETGEQSRAIEAYLKVLELDPSREMLIVSWPRLFFGRENTRSP